MDLKHSFSSAVLLQNYTGCIQTQESNSQLLQKLVQVENELGHERSPSTVEQVYICSAECHEAV